MAEFLGAGQGDKISSSHNSSNEAGDNFFCQSFGSLEVLSAKCVNFPQATNGEISDKFLGAGRTRRHKFKRLKFFDSNQEATISPLKLLSPPRNFNNQDVNYLDKKD